MKKIIAMLVMACAFSVAHANFDAKAQAFIQPFDKSYAFSLDYLWYTDIDMTDPAGSYCDIWSEILRLRATYPAYSFSHVGYAGLLEFEFGFAPPLYYATIYSDINRYK
jgi:hypothetical protein